MPHMMRNLRGDVFSPLSFLFSLFYHSYYDFKYESQLQPIQFNSVIYIIRINDLDPI